ncbi:HAD family hydrolase [Acidovorax sp. sic0104]|uniref:HAD family hydrolase n=1 Tax=Acidovorax sp. sic0104 TaxID=2854784 RepID=UPI001C484167|nr:HAD family hydrolase [Acidovorax sp. sic0104]MBV7540408.1 HAD family hydrolase [Acidovorax sp. sic0104]
MTETTRRRPTPNLPYTAAIFDLDNCLMDARAMGTLFETAFVAIRQANQGTLSPDVLEDAIAQCWYTAFDLVAERYGFSDAMRDAGWQAFISMEMQPPLSGYADLGLLPALPVRRYLVTSGFRRLQQSKIDVLGIAPWFERVVIDAIDEPGPHGKARIFSEILAQERCEPEQVLVVGDNPLSELGAGRALGMVTVQTVRPGVSPWDEADHHVLGLQGVGELLAGAQLPA